ncbi:MAG: hypothetical protein ACR2PG_19085 [Hyphomicrobiaceae bacterium]
MVAVFRTFFMFTLLLVIMCSGNSRADWMNLTGAETAPNIAEMTILEDRVRVALEVYIGDLDTFQALVPDDWFQKSKTNAPRPNLADRLKLFSEQTLQVLADDGIMLQAELKRAEPRLRKNRMSPFAGSINPLTRQRVSSVPKDKRVLYAEIEYRFKGLPQTLTFVPPADNEGRAEVTIGFIAYHKSVPIIDFRYLSGPATVELDWADPWYTKFNNPNLKRHHESALMSFLYVEPREVRHEILIRVRDLQNWTELGLPGAMIGHVEQERIKTEARNFFASRNPVTVDGRSARPASTRAEFLEVSLQGLRVIEENAPIDASTAIVGVILSYPIPGIPDRVRVRWELFNDRITRIPASAVDPVGPLLSYIEPDDPILEWRNHLLKYEEPKVKAVSVAGGRSICIPVLSIGFLGIALTMAYLARSSRVVWRRKYVLGCAISLVMSILFRHAIAIDLPNPFAGAPDSKVATEIIAGVIDGANTAYLETEPHALRRALSVIALQDKLADVEAELSRAVAVKVLGGGIARVNGVDELVLSQVKAIGGHTGFSSLAEWTARASASHWGHLHRRTIRFRALLDVVHDHGTWKLAGITVLSAKQQPRSKL